MVEVFKTNISNIQQSEMLTRKLSEHFPESDIYFDLQDCDNVLRVEGDDICAEKIIGLLTADGYHCEVLE